MPEILIYSDIGESWFAEESITAATIKPQLSGDLTVRVNSPGGDVFEGFAIYNLLKQHDGKVDVYVDGLAASAASIIAMAGDNIYMSESSMLMIHDPWTMAAGGAEDLTKTADLLDKIKEAIIPAYTSITGIEADEIALMMAEETWLTGAEAADRGFATLIGDEETQQRVSNSVKPWIRNAPKHLQKAEAKAPEPKQAKPEETEPESKVWRVKLEKRRLSLLE